jgi:hypothetical protein
MIASVGDHCELGHDWSVHLRREMMGSDMELEIVLGGLLENAFMAAVTQHQRSEHFAPGHPYYESLYRRTDPAYFHRAATFVALASSTKIPLVDWGMNDADGFRPSELGITLCDSGFDAPFREWDDDAMLLSAVALEWNAFSPETLNDLLVYRVGDKPIRRPPKARDVAGLKVDPHALHHLCRLLLQVRTVADQPARLVLAETDHRILCELLDFIEGHQLAIPFGLPEVRRKAFIEADGLVGGLIHFTPTDVLALQAAATDGQVRRYAQQVRPFLCASTSTESRRGLVAAMKETDEKADRVLGARRVFEFASILAKPFAAFGATLLVAGMKAWLNRKHTEANWHLVSARMSDVAHKDYLRRAHNF